jgi:hypothetical protein
VIAIDKINECFKYSNTKEYGATYLDLAVGSRVRVTYNLSTSLGLYNGATGTVVKIAFLNKAQMER